MHSSPLHAAADATGVTVVVQPARSATLRMRGCGGACQQGCNKGGLHFELWGASDHFSCGGCPLCRTAVSSLRCLNVAGAFTIRC